MAIRPYLLNEAFDPETIETMGEAFTDVLKALGLADREDQITELVASHIVELAHLGIRTKSALVIRAMEDFRANPQ